MKSLISETTKSAFKDNVEENAVFEVLLRRKSTRAYGFAPVPAWKLQRLMEAARWAPSSYNEQPWRYIVTSTETPVERQRLLECLSESNQSWAKDAPVLILATVSTAHARTGQNNRHALYDLGQSVANISTEATALGLAMHQIGGFSMEQARSASQIPDGVEPVVVIALGNPGNPSTLPERLRSLESSPRIRKPITETAFYGTWNGRAITATEPD